MDSNTTMHQWPIGPHVCRLVLALTRATAEVTRLEARLAEAGHLPAAVFGALFAPQETV